MTFEKNQLHSDTILLKTSSLFQSKNIDGFILNHLKRNENKCHNNGFVIPDSTVLVQRSIGKVVSINNQNFFVCVIVITLSHVKLLCTMS